jgi:hypothetical protein
MIVAFGDKNLGDELYLGRFIDVEAHRKRDGLFGVGSVEVKVIIIIDYEAVGWCQ